MAHFNESFYTDDFDQEMLDYIRENYDITRFDKTEWRNCHEYLIFHKPSDYFFTWKNTSSLSATFLSKEQFKEKIGMKKFAKSDLRDGMCVHLRDGSKRIFINNTLISTSGTLSYEICFLLDDFTDNLLDRRACTPCDIIRVIDRDGTVLFEREDNTEVTMQEVADKFNIPLEQLRIKD